MKIVFMGTPDFALPGLKRLITDGHELLAVFTQPDKPQGRKMVLTPPPVKVCALEHNIPVYQPEKLKDPEVLSLLEGLAPDLIVVIAYGKILPESILQLPPFGCVNVHASLLPKYRGAGPIQWSVIDGEEKTGVTTMYMAKGLDTGDMILQGETPIDPDETAGELHDRLSILGAEILHDTIVLLEKGTAPRTVQEDSLSNYAPMLTKELAKLDFTKPALQLHNLVRGLNPWPVACTRFHGKLLKVYRTRVVSWEKPGVAGAILEEDRFLIGCGKDALELLEVQLEGSRRMSAEEFLRGKKLNVGEKLTWDSN